MWVSIKDNCVGCGACAVINPEVFEMSDKVATVYQSKVLGNEESCIDAALSCPVNAIKIDDY